MGNGTILRHIYNIEKIKKEIYVTEKNMLQRKIIITHIKTRNKMGNNTDKQFLFPDFNDFY